MNKGRRIGRMALCLIVSFVMIMTLIPRLPANLAYAATGQTPPHTKTLTDNHDGTYTLSLDVVGESEKKPNNVNVTVILDVSGSMDYRISQWSWTTRMDAAQEAVNSLADKLYAYNTTSNPDTVEMALVTFSNTATIAQQPTNNATTFKNAVNRADPEGGTNWEGALQTAKTVDFGDNDQTFVIFVSDGNPSFRFTEGNYPNHNNDYDRDYYRAYGVWGTGDDTVSTTVSRCYEHAVDDAQALAQQVGVNNFFTIGAFGSVTRMQSLTTAAGAPAENYYSAADTDALNQAIADILAKIEMSGIGNASIGDGTTNQVTTSSGEVAELLEVDTTSFKYYRSGGTYGTNQPWADAPEAEFKNGAVEWDLSEEGVLENGVRYTVTFDCYPSQTTYDTIAKLKNGDITYASLDSEIKKYIVDNGGGSYSLLTNTNATLSYDDTRDDAGQQTVDYTNPDPVGTDAATMSVKKTWENELDARKVGSINMTVLMDNEEFHDVTLSADDTPAWTKEGIFISPGIIKNGKVLTGAEGHDFTFKELGSEQYNWELVAPTVHPMLIDGTLTMLTMVDEAHTAPSGAQTYTINGKTYYSNGSSAASLDAYNYRRSNLNLTKVVTGEDAPKDATFPFTLTVNNGKASTGSADDTNSDYYVWFSIYDTKAGQNVKDATIGNATLSIDERTGDYYYYAKSGSAITVEMKDGWNLRFTNLPTETTYTFAEGTMPTGFAFNKAELTAGTDSTFKGAQTSTGTIEATNTSYTVTYTNDYQLTDLEITKEWSDADNQDGKRLTADELKAKLTLSPAVEGKEATVVDNEDGTYTITYTGLPRFNNGTEVEYTVAESAIDGYTTTGSPAKDHGTITNTHEPEVIDIDVEKVWVGPAGDAVTVTLYADKKATDKTLTLNAQNQWKGTFEDLPVYAAGKEIEYSVVEDGVSGVDASKYTTTIEGDAENGFTITNTNTETVDVTATKTWSDADNQDGKRPAELELTVNGLPDGTTAPEPTIAESGNNWTYTWSGLPKYKADGTLYTYTISENTVPQGYTKSPEDPVPSGGTITNSYTPEVTTVSVTKAWADANNQDGKRPDDLTLTLNGLPDGVTAPEPTINKDGNNWTYTWSGLPRYANGNVIAYTVTEGTVPANYTCTTTTVDAGGTITNTHTPEKTEVTVNKIWEGDDAWKDSVRPDSITVNLLADGEAAVDYDGKAVPAATVKADDEGNWTYTFTNLPKYKDGNAIVYTSEEAAVAGYDTTYSNDKLTITNTYNPTPTTATFDVTKNLVVPEGLAGPDEWSYKFKATQGEGAPAPAAAEQTVDQDKTTATFTFAENAFTKPGTYTYTVTEEGTYAYITNDAAAATGKTVTITVTGDKQGRLTAAVTGADEGGKTTTFTNTYKITTPDIVDPPVKKVLNGTELAKYDGQFTFKIEGKTAPEGVTTIPMPTNTTITNSEQYAKDVEGETFYEFGNIEYTVPGTYTYEISEVSGTLEEITYDTNKYTMTVEVVDNGDGTVTATMTPEAGKFVFTNVYSAEGSATLEANKVLSGREWKEGETFTFELRDANGATVGQPVQVSKDNPKATFTLPYTLEDVGEHKYTITETGTLPSGVTKSADIKATVTVSDAGAGELSTSVAYEDDNNTITNTYEASSVKAAVNVSKTIDGYIAGTDDNGNVVDRTFNFTMTGPKIDGQLETSITTSNGEGTSAFNEIEYTLADLVDEDGNYVSIKDFVYTVTETAGSDAGFTYDDKTYNVTVTVTDDQNGKLSATVKYADEDQTSVEVVNEYEMTNAKVTLTLTKTIEDQSNSAPDGTFNFKLYKDSVSDENFVEEKSITTNKLTGSVDFSELTFEAAGEYIYKVVEENGSTAGFTYDTTEHTYKIVIDNDFNAAVLLLDEENSTLKAEITNVYKAEEVSNALKVKKEINDTSGSAYETTFTFTLTGPNEYTDEVTVTGATEGTFKAITYDKAGTYEYTIKETKGDAAGYQYDETEYKVKVTVEDVDGKLVATAAYIDKEGESQTSLTITNTYDPEDAKITLEARKIVDDQTGGATAKTFTFELVDAEGKVISTKSIQGGGTVQFDEQTYSKVGEYKYNIHEVKGSDKGYTYDTKDYPVTVTVTDPDKDGRLKAEATEGAEIVITNTYKADPTKATIELTKELTGRDMNEGEFTFTLTDLNGEEPDPIQTATNTADGKVVFDEIEYTVSGEFNYEVSEVVPEETKGVTYDQNKIKVTVNVIDDGEGALKAEVVYPANATFKNVYEAAGSFTPEAKKVLENKALTDGQFSFKIEGPEGKLPANTTVTNKADGTITFGEIKYDQTDAGKTYEYTITEVKGSLPEITYDSGKITLKVTITDNGDGTLKVTGEYGSKTSFTNKYTEPKTGDTTIVVPYIVIGVSSLILLLMLLFRTRKNRA